MPFALLLGVLFSVVGPVAAQQPAPAPPPEPPLESIMEEIDTPEVQASRDLERMGETKTRLRAVERLKAAETRAKSSAQWQAFGPGANRWFGICRSLSNTREIRDLSDAVRYYASAHGLSSDVDALSDARKEADDMAASGSEVVLPSARERQEGAVRRWGEGIYSLFEAIEILKACETPAPAPPRTVSDAGPPGESGGLSKNAKIATGAGVVLAGVGVAALSGGGDNTTDAVAAINVSRFYGNFTATLNILSTSIPGCGQLGTSQVPITLSGNPDGSGFVLNKGGLVFNGVMQGDGRFRVTRAGPMNFPGLPNGTSVNWEYDGTARENGFTGDGRATAPCGVISTSLEGTRRN